MVVELTLFCIWLVNFTILLLCLCVIWFSVLSLFLDGWYVGVLQSNPRGEMFASISSSLMERFRFDSSISIGSSFQVRLASLCFTVHTLTRSTKTWNVLSPFHRKHLCWARHIPNHRAKQYKFHYFLNLLCTKRHLGVNVNVLFARRRNGRCR